MKNKVVIPYLVHGDLKKVSYRFLFSFDSLNKSEDMNTSMKYTIYMDTTRIFFP